MKKALYLVVIIAVGFGIYYFVHSRSAEAPITVAPATTKPDPSNATFQFEDGPITLKNGSASTNLTPTSELSQETDLTDTITYGDLNNDGKTDAAFLLVQTSSGTGTFFNVAAYVSGVVTYKGSNALFLGDRIAPKTITIKNGIITVTYLDRGATDPMSSDPTILTTKHFVYTQGTLAEKN